MPIEPIESKWRIENGELVREFEFAHFDEAFAFMQRAAEIIKKQDHHPTWTNAYNKVEIRLCTHDAANTITEKDWRLATALDDLVISPRL